MPATNPRISVTVPPSVDAILSRLSVLTGQSKSSFIADLLESSMPVFERMATVLAAAQQAKDTLKSQSRKDLEAAEEQLHKVLGVTMDIFDQTTKPILDEAERIQRRKAGAGGGDALSRAPASAPAGPPLVTRGSGTPKQAKSTAAKTIKTVKKGAGKGLKTASGASKKKTKG